MDYFSKGIKHTLRVLKKIFKEHKLLLTILFLLQFAFLLSVFFVFLTYQIKIAENIQNIAAPFQKANYDVNQLQSGQPFLTEMYQVYQSYKSLVTNLIQMGGWIISIFIFLNGPIWLISHSLSRKEEKKLSWRENTKLLARQFLKFTVSFFVLLGPFILVSYLIVKTFFSLNLMSESANFGSNLPFYLLVFFCFTFYLFLLTCAVINSESWKKFLQKFFTLAVKKILPVFLIAITNLTLLGIPVALLYLTVNHQNLQLLISLNVFLFLLMLILTKIIWINCLREIAGD